MGKRYQIPTINGGSKSKSKHLGSSKRNTNKGMEGKNKSKVLAVIMKILAILSIAVTLVIYTVHRAANTLVFWESFPRYHVWLHNNEANITGMALTAILITAFFSTLASSILLVIYLLTKSFLAWQRTRQKN